MANNLNTRRGRENGGYFCLIIHQEWIISFIPQESQTHIVQSLKELPKELQLMDSGTWTSIKRYIINITTILFKVNK